MNNTLDIKQYLITLCLVALTGVSQVLTAQNCNETSFPSLGPGALRGKTCNDIANPVNIGTLDCRTNKGGYSQRNVTLGNGSRVTYGVYSVTGGTQRYDGTRTRVERSFHTVQRGANQSSTFKAKFVIDDLSDGNTCIVQAHALGDIVAGQKRGQEATSAVFLLYAKKTNNANTFELEVHESTTPYTTTTGGARTRTFFRNVTRGTEYTMEYTTGYDASNNAFSIITVAGNASDTQTATLMHTFTTESVVTRYGAYGTGDFNDVTAELWFRDVTFCRSNTAITTNQAPSVTINSPADQARFELGQEIRLAANATDPDGNLEKLNFKIDDSFYVSDNARPFETTFMPTRAGTYKIAARAFDRENLQTEVFVTVTVEPRNEAPIASFSSPSTNSLEEGYTELVITVEASDPNGDDMSIMLKINGEEVRPESVAPYEWGHQGSPNPSETLGLVAGDHLIEAVVTDSKGRSTTIRRNITVRERVVTGNAFEQAIDPFLVFPNPSESGVFNLSDSMVFEVYSLNGELLLRGEGNQVDISGFSKGVYLLRGDQKVIKLVR